MTVLRRPEVLIVEDDEFDREAFGRIARRHGIDKHVSFCVDAESALQRLNGFQSSHGVAPVLVFTDLNMPGMDGHELIQEIRSTPRIANSIVVVVSTSDLDSDLRRAYSNGVAGYVVKDSSGQSLDHVIQMARHYCAAVAIAA